MAPLSQALFASLYIIGLLAHLTVYFRAYDVSLDCAIERESGYSDIIVNTHTFQGLNAIELPVSATMLYGRWPTSCMHCWLAGRPKFARTPVAYYIGSDATFNISLIPLSGDVQLNPGPTTTERQSIDDNNDVDHLPHSKPNSSFGLNESGRISVVYSVDYLLRLRNQVNHIDYITANTVKSLGLRRQSRPRGSMSGSSCTAEEDKSGSRETPSCFTRCGPCIAGGV